MLGLSDKMSGGGMLLLAGLVILYYTLWAILLPFFDNSSPIHNWFPPREWVVRIPAFILVLGISAMGLFLGSRIVSTHRNHLVSRKGAKIR